MHCHDCTGEKTEEVTVINAACRYTIIVVFERKDGEASCLKVTWPKSEIVNFHFFMGCLQMFGYLFNLLRIRST